MNVRMLTCAAMAVIGLSASLAGPGTASADDFAGSTYSDALALISSRNATAVIATVSGNKLALADCIVSSAHQSVFLDSSQNGSNRTSEVVLNLNCNAQLAGPGVSGNSLATPEGRRAKKALADGAYIAEHLDECYKDDETLTYCQRICASTKQCEI